MTVEIAYYDVRLVSLQGVGMVQVVICTWSVRATAGSSTVMSSTLSSSQTEIPSLIKTELS